MAKDFNKILELVKDEKLSKIMPELIHFATEIGNDELKQWLLLEYNGYYGDNKATKDSTEVPEYRQVPGQFFDYYNRPLIIEDPDLSFINFLKLRNTVTELENFKDNKFYQINDPQLNSIINKHFKVKVHYFSFHGSSVIPILDSIRSHLLTLLLNLKESTTTLDETSESVSFHPIVEKVAGKLFNDGHYRNAILDTFIELVDVVKTKSGRFDLDGTPLMQTVFSPKNPILKISENIDEQQGYMWMFSGAVMAIRNSHAHKVIKPETRQETIEWLGFASALLKILDKAELINSKK
jgi:uncharacterized protein (TIGR02391 family)